MVVQPFLHSGNNTDGHYECSLKLKGEVDPEVCVICLRLFIPCRSPTIAVASIFTFDIYIPVACASLNIIQICVERGFQVRSQGSLRGLPLDQEREGALGGSPRRQETRQGLCQGTSCQCDNGVCLMWFMCPSIVNMCPLSISFCFVHFGGCLFRFG